MQILAIAAGGSMGALARYWMANAVYALAGRDFPWGTLVVNVLGCMLMGFLYLILLERVADSSEWRALLLVGFLGAFTTFSTFSMETLLLVQSGELVKALANVLVSVFLCLLAVWAGMLIARQW